jgi:Zn-dependent protease
MLESGFIIFRIRGIPVRLHPSLLLFLPFVAISAMQQIHRVAWSLDVPAEAFRLPPLAWGILLAVGLFVAVLIHELAHSLVALRSGARVRSITLMMLGGVSLIEGELSPRREAWMAFAGPLASFGLAAVSYLFYRYLPLPVEVRVALFTFSGTNAILGIFNLLPAFPMDGGRVVRGLLAGRIGKERATLVAARLGKGMAALFAAYALYSFNLILLLIAWFVYTGAGAEQERLSMVHLLKGVPVTDFMSDRLGEARIDETVGEVLRRLLRGGLAGARVVDPRDPWAFGVVTADDLEGVAARGGMDAPVSAAMGSGLAKVHPGDDASQALEALSNGETRAVLVVGPHEEVLGVVTPGDLRRAVALGRLQRS